MTEKKETLFLSVEYSWFDRSDHSPYSPIEVCIDIKKNETNGKFHLIEEGMEDSPWYYDKEYDTFDDAFQYLYDYEYSLGCFQINDIKPNLIFFYTKKLIEDLNTHYKEDYKWIVVESFKDKLPFDSFKEKLGINLKMIKDANKKGLQAIKITKFNGKANEEKKFLIGKLSTEGNMIRVTDENDSIIYLTTGDNVTIESEMIKNDYYWYFTI